MCTGQETRPANFAELWRVAGWTDEHEHATKLCKSLGYERDDDGNDVVRVQFIGQTDMFEPGEALISPHMLLPA